MLPRPVKSSPPGDGQAPRDLQIARDRALAKRMLRGDQRAVKEFCDAYLPRLFRFALRRVATPEDADDVVQIVLSNAARRIETYRGEATLYAWLAGICQREAAKHAAAASRHRLVVSFHDEDVLTAVVEKLKAPALEEPDAVSMRLQLISRVRDCLDALPERYAEVLELKYVDGYSSKEIATGLGVSDEAVQSLLARARRTFREVCDDRLLRDMETDNGEG